MTDHMFKDTFVKIKNGHIVYVIDYISETRELNGFLLPLKIKKDFDGVKIKLTKFTEKFFDDEEYINNKYKIKIVFSNTETFSIKSATTEDFSYVIAKDFVVHPDINYHAFGGFEAYIKSMESKLEVSKANRFAKYRRKSIDKQIQHILIEKGKYEDRLKLHNKGLRAYNKLVKEREKYLKFVEKYLWETPV